MRVLLLGTHPIERPLHGGQRRAAEILAAYRQAGAECLYLAVYPRDRYRDNPATERSYRFSYGRIGWLEPSSYAEDVYSGVFAAEDDECYAWLRAHVLRFAPTHIHLEQPFMYPAVSRLSRDGLSDFALVYSSQNVEGPLKRRMLEEVGADRAFADKLVSFVEELEDELTRTADLVICASEHERPHYESAGARRVIVCRNGATALAARDARSRRPGARFLLTVGSGHLPNSSGFAELLLAPALFFLPPRPALIVAGDMTWVLERDGRFAAYRDSNLRRADLRGAVSDDELEALKTAAHGFLLPILQGGGTNLKTAEAILSGKWAVATTTAMRGFEEFRREPGVVIEDDPRGFRRAVRDVLGEPPLALSASARRTRETVSWECSLAPLEEWVRRQAR